MTKYLDATQLANIDQMQGIEKSSSAELTEAINSMYRWYKRSRICYAYLSDLPGSGLLDETLSKSRWL